MFCLPKGALSACKRAPFALEYATFYASKCHLLQNKGNRAPLVKSR